MDILKNNTENLFLSPVALIPSNGTEIDDRIAYHGNYTTNVTVPYHVWNKVNNAPNLPHRLENISEIIRRELKWTFILHTYGFGCLFFMLSFYTFFSVLNLRSFISNRPFMSTINGFLSLLGASRAGSLLIDPYNLKENMPRIIGQILWDLGFPSILSAFCLVQLVFLQLTQLQIGPEGFRRKSCLSLIITAHFILTIGMDIIVAYHENLTVVKHIIQYIFLTWGVFLCCNFLYSGYKVMSMIRSIPGGLKHRNLPDPTYKGIMQLAILAPHNNLAGSVTAALLPTLCAPKIHQQDNTSLSAVGFRSDGSSRILESESIPILEETGSSGDEKSPNLLTRGSSFQNQIRNTQKFNLKPKLSLRSVSDKSLKDEQESSQGKSGGPKSPKQLTPKNQSPKILSGKGNEFNFNVKQSTNGILRTTENFVTTKSLCEFKSKIQNKTSFENENFYFSNGKKLKTEINNSKLSSKPITSDNVIPNILISSPAKLENNENATNEEDELKSGDNNNKNQNSLINEIKQDLCKMEIIREKPKNDIEEIADVHIKRNSKKEKSQLTPKSRRKNKVEFEKLTNESRKGSQSSEQEIEKNNSRKNSLTGVQDEDSSERGNDSIGLLDITKLDQISCTTPSIRGRKKPKSLTWKKKDKDEEEERSTQECLLPQENITDVSLRSVLNHIAYINRGQQRNVNNEDDLEKARKSKLEWVLNITYITAMWGLMLCLSNMGRIYSPFGIPETRKILSPISMPSQSNSTQSQEQQPTESNEIIFSSWPWLWFQTFCRALELAMGCAMANITRQPTVNYRYPRTLSIRRRDTFYSM